MTTAAPIHNIILMANDIGEVGGVQRVVHTLAQGFARRGYPVLLIGVNEPDTMHPYIDEPLYEMQHLYRARPDMTDEEHLETRAMGVKRLRTILTERVPGIVITTQLFSASHLDEAGRHGWRVISQYHDSPTGEQGRRDARNLRRWTLDADVLLLLTEGDASAVRASGFNNARAMPNPLRTPPEDAAPLDAKVAMYAGRFSPQKSVDHLLRAWSLVHERHPDWELHVFGSGPDEDDLRQLCRELALDDCVRWFPAASDVDRELLQRSMFVLSSQHEGLPMVLLEALSCGVPCVSFRCSSGVEQLIQDGENGLLVEQNDDDALADAICRLISEPDLRHRLGSNARGSTQQYDTEKVLDAWQELFLEVLR